MKLRFKKFLVLVTLDMSIDGLLVMKKYLFLKSISQVEDNLISIGLYSICKEIYLKFNS